MFNSSQGRRASGARLRVINAGLGRLMWRQAIVLGLVAALLLALQERIAELEFSRVVSAFASVGIGQWGLAAVFTAISFWAVGRYDAVVHRLRDTGVPQRAAVTSGATAIAVAQTLGLGAATGTLVRWRLLPELDLRAAAGVSVMVSLSFIAAWAVLAAFALLLVPLPLPGGPAVALGVLVAAMAFAGLSVFQPRWFGTRLRVPPLRAIGAFLALALLDTLAAGAALWILLPAELEASAAEVLAAYLLALGAGLVLNTPGGVGPFEVALVALLPALDAEPLLAAVLAFRAVYYAVPAVLGGVVLLRGPGFGPLSAPRRRPLANPAQPSHLVDAIIEKAPRAEAALLRHGRLAILSDLRGEPLALAAVSGQSLVVLGDPVRLDVPPKELLATARLQARASLRAPVLYKAGSRLARTARAIGWTVLPVAEEAWVDPQAFSPDGSRRRRLRRKLRRAEAAGIGVTAAMPGHTLPRREMARIAAGWAERRGGERRFSMGAWEPEALEWAHSYLARDRGGRLVGFVTVHANAHEHALDLMRVAENAPDGTMYALIAAAIEGAHSAGVSRFSLAAVPAAPSPREPRPLRWLRDLFWRRSGAEGLRQFKQAFAPRWNRLYIAAPSRLALAFGALDILREITRSGPTPRS